MNRSWHGKEAGKMANPPAEHQFADRGVRLKWKDRLVVASICSFEACAPLAEYMYSLCGAGASDFLQVGWRKGNCEVVSADSAAITAALQAAWPP